MAAGESVRGSEGDLAMGDGHRAQSRPCCGARHHGGWTRAAARLFLGHRSSRPAFRLDGERSTDTGACGGTHTNPTNHKPIAGKRRLFETKSSLPELV